MIKNIYFRASARRTFRAAAALAVFIAMFPAAPGRLFAAGPKIIPVATIAAGGGRYLYGSSFSDGLNADVYFCPTLNFSRATAVLPFYFGSYRGLKDIRESVVGGALLQETQSHTGGLRFTARSAGNLRLSASASVKTEYLKETRDEDWGSGLFDSRRAMAGFEIEKLNLPAHFRFGADYYTMRYPNYRALVSAPEYESQFDAETYQELTENAGADVLDNDNVAVFMAFSRAVSPRATLGFSFDVLVRNFPDQKVVAGEGSFSPELRRDFSAMPGINWRLRVPRADFSLSSSIQFYNSTQNSFDASAGKFLLGYYNFSETAVSPAAAFYVGKSEPFSRLEVSADFTSRAYPERRIQNTRGAYLDENMIQSGRNLSVSLTYPVWTGLSAKFHASWRAAESNMKYERVYRYNYDVYTYYGGFNWQI